MNTVWPSYAWQAPKRVAVAFYSRVHYRKHRAHYHHVEDWEACIHTPRMPCHQDDTRQLRAGFAHCRAPCTAVLIVIKYRPRHCSAHMGVQCYMVQVKCGLSRAVSRAIYTCAVVEYACMGAGNCQDKALQRPSLYVRNCHHLTLLEKRSFTYSYVPILGLSFTFA
jgi:hypothetical protein